MISNMFYFHYINAIGGVEQFFYEIAKKYKHLDIVIYYNNGNQKQIDRLKKYVDVRKYDGKSIIQCKKAFFNYKANIIDNVEAEEYYMIIHADYKTQKIDPPHYSKPLKYIGVSQLACDNFTEISGKPCELCYNPITLDMPKKILTLISATRLTAEKGKKRILQLANALDKHNIPYEWYIYTNDTNAINHPHIHYKSPTLNINDEIIKADYVVQLSDCESYCYTMIQSLLLKVPIIVCNWPVLKELKIDNQYGFILPFNMKDIPVDEIYNRTQFNFPYTPPKDRWGEILYNAPSTYQHDLNTYVTVEATREYQKKNVKDAYLNRIPVPGEQWTVNLKRAKYLTGDNQWNANFVKIIKTQDL